MVMMMMMMRNILDRNSRGNKNARFIFIISPPNIVPIMKNVEIYGIAR